MGAECGKEEKADQWNNGPKDRHEPKHNTGPTYQIPQRVLVMTRRDSGQDVVQCRLGLQDCGQWAKEKVEGQALLAKRKRNPIQQDFCVSL